jgi:hypothetical protein
MFEVHPFFQDKIKITESGCWEWTKGKVSYGYGVAWYKGQGCRAHRLSYQLYFGEIPDGLCICHKCDNPTCINPEHLFLGTNKDNIRDRDAKGHNANDRKKYCKFGHEFTIDNTYNYCGSRYCKMCHCLRSKKRYAIYKQSKISLSSENLRGECKMEKIEMLVTNLIAAVIQQQRANPEYVVEKTNKVMEIRRELFETIKEITHE